VTACCIGIGDDVVFSAIVLMIAVPVLATPMLLKLAIEFKVRV
jgi:hypothetical protein